MNKIQVNNICAVALIYCADDPSKIFIERKTADYPVKVFANMLCLPGGNWVGEAAKSDANPETTLRRELDEEFRLAVSEGNVDEMAALGFGAGADGRDLQRDTFATMDDIERFRIVKKSMLAGITPFMDALITIPKTLFDSVDPQNKRGDITILASYFTIGLDGADWNELVRLQEKYGNLSNESETLIATSKEMRDKKMVVSWGHDAALGVFFRQCTGIGIPLLQDIKWQCLGMSLSSYDEYKENYEIVKQP